MQITKASTKPNKTTKINTKLSKGSLGRGYASYAFCREAQKLKVELMYPLYTKTVATAYSKQAAH